MLNGQFKHLLRTIQMCINETLVNKGEQRNKMAGEGGTKLFSSDEASAMEKRIDSHPLSSSRLYRKNCLESYYEIHRCARFALDGGYKMVRLLVIDFSAKAVIFNSSE